MLLDLLLLWDAIFADSDRFDLPNYILVAMLVHIRDKRGYSPKVLLRFEKFVNFHDCSSA